MNFGDQQTWAGVPPAAMVQLGHPGLLFNLSEPQLSHVQYLILSHLQKLYI